MTVLEIIKKYLDENGYDGLYNEEFDCGCIKDDLVPCDDMGKNCSPGYERIFKVGEDCGLDCSDYGEHWHIQKDKTVLDNQ
jgi:hypothetical protein